VKRIIFGPGTAAKVGEEAARIGGRRAMLVTGSYLDESGAISRVKESLDGEGIHVDVFNEVQPEPPLELADKITERVRTNKYDLIVGCGGGSSMDVAKVGSVLYTNPGRAVDYTGSDKLPQAGLPTIMIPTTAGTGSEVSDVIVLRDVEKRVKRVIVSPHAFASTAIVDPLMTLSMPQRVTAASGIDALCHCIEGLTSSAATAFTDALGLEAIRLIASNLRQAFANGNDLDARYNMSLAALMGGVQVANTRTNLIHAAAYSFAVRYKAELGYPVPLDCIPHGVSLAIALPYCVKFNALANMQKFAKIAEAMGEDVSGLTLREAGMRAGDACMDLVKDLGLPTSLKEIGVPKEAIGELAKTLMGFEAYLKRNPRMVTLEDAINIFRGMWEGPRA